ncbi:hypothetical protein KSP39_PZI001582 [Platanthera zijinensis]|uniref:CASP-like protein n=1 Tax=Platanthera zijinensis TaxID=2320716 RepID=A0AAP0C1E4_9ASPA
MNSGGATSSTTIDIGSTDAVTKGIAPPPPATKDVLPPPAAAPLPPPPPPRRRFLFSRFFRGDAKTPRGRKRGLAIFDFFLRLFAIAALVAAIASMGTDDETLPFVTFNFQFHANFADFPALLFFVIADAIALGYLVLSIPLSIACIIRPALACPRLFLLTFDLIAFALTVAGSSAAAAIVYLAHTGSSKANWLAFCIRFQDFCQQSSGAVIASLVGAAILLLIVALSALSLRRR